MPTASKQRSKLSDGLLVVENADGGEPLILSAKFACPVSGFTIDEIEPRLFSFNNPFGACPTCDGLGRKLYMDPEMVVPEPERSLADGAIEPWNNTDVDLLRSDPCRVGRTFRCEPGNGRGRIFRRRNAGDRSLRVEGKAGRTDL